MATSKKAQAEVQAISALRGAALDVAGRDQLRAALASRSSALIAAASRVIGQDEVEGFAAELAAAFERLLPGGAQADKGCIAKTALARALLATDGGPDALWLKAIRCVQFEPVWGGQEDSATELRALAAAALVNADYPDVMSELARLLADPEIMARVGAAQALGATRHVDAARALLRYKVLSGDADPRVTAACLASLLRSPPATSLSFVVERLEHEDAAQRELAALALGESRLEGALAGLCAASERAALPNALRPLLLAIALLRSAEGNAYLLQRIAGADEATARLAIEALSVFRHDANLRDQVLAAARRPKLAAFARERFGD